MNILFSRGFFLLLIVLLLLNAPLRPSETISLTPYYVLSPLILVVLFFVERRKQIVSSVAFAFFVLLYGFVVGALNDTSFEVRLFQTIKYLQLLTLFWYLSYSFTRNPLLLGMAEKIIFIFVCFIFIFALVQQVTGMQIPTIVNDGSSYWLNTFFFTPNDLGLFLATYCIYLLHSNFRNSNIALVWFFAFILNVRNDSKAALLASLVALIIFSFLYLRSKSLIYKSAVFLGFLFIVLLVYIFWFGDIVAILLDSPYDPIALFLDPFNRIYRLETYDLGGSIFDRTDALINCIKALKENNWLGLGQGGSVYTLSLPQYEVLTAKSLHNAIGEWLVDFGPVAFLFLIYFYQKYFRLFFIRKLSTAQIRILVLLCVSPLLSVSQSAGYISNYSFWIIFFLCFYSLQVSSSEIGFRKA